MALAHQRAGEPIFSFILCNQLIKTFVWEKAEVISIAENLMRVLMSLGSQRFYNHNAAKLLWQALNNVKMGHFQCLTALFKFPYVKYLVYKVWTKVYSHFYFRGVTSTHSQRAKKETKITISFVLIFFSTGIYSTV